MVTALPNDNVRREFLDRNADATLTTGTRKCCCNPFLISDRRDAIINK